MNGLASKVTTAACLLACCLASARTSWSKPQTAAEEHVQRGQELQKAGDLRGAAEEYRAAIRMDPRDVPAHTRLGLVLEIAGRLNEARAECERAVELQPKSADGHTCLGIALRESGKLAGAISQFRRVVELNPGAASAHEDLGAALELEGKFAEAIAELRKALAIAPDRASAWNAVGWLYATASDEKFRDGKKALECAQRAVELSGGQAAYILDTLAEAYFANGDVDRAIETEERAIALDPNDPAYAIQKEKFKAAKNRRG